MATALEIDVDESGFFVAQIPDANGELHAYRVSLGVKAPWTVTFTRADSDERHEIREVVQGKWACSCKAFEFRKKRGQAQCKHCAAGKALRVMLQSLAESRRLSELSSKEPSRVTV